MRHHQHQHHHHLLLLLHLHHQHHRRQNQNQKSLMNMKGKPLRNLKGIHRVGLHNMSACGMHWCLDVKRSQRCRERTREHNTTTVIRGQINVTVPGSIMVGHRYWMPPPRQFQPMFQVSISTQLLWYTQSVWYSLKCTNVI